MFIRQIALPVVLLSALVTPGELTSQPGTPDEVLAKAVDIYRDEGPREALPEFEHALALYRGASDRRGEAVTLGYIGNCYKRFGDFEPALGYLNRALAMKRELAGRLEEGKTLSHLGLVYWEMADYELAIDHFNGAIAIAQELDDPKLEGSSLNNLSLVYDELGDYERSLEQYQRVLDLYRGIDFPRGESDTLGNIGGVYLLLGKYRKASDYYRQAFAISESLDSKPSMSQDLGNLALCQLGLGDVSEALETFDRALDLARDAGLKKEEADWLKGKGTALVRVGKYDLGLEMYRRALESYERAGLKRELIEALAELGTLHVLLGDLSSAEGEFRRAFEMARAIENTRGVITNLIALGHLEWRQTRYEQAAALYHQALDLASKADDRAHMAECLIQLAHTSRDQGRLDEALREAQNALSVSRGIEARLEIAESLYAMAEIERLQDNNKQALEHFAAGEEIAQALGEPDLGWRLAYGRGQALEAMNRDGEAVSAYRQAAEIIEAVRSRLQENRFRAGYIEDKYQVYVALVRLLLKQGRADEAFLFSEKLRARSYVEILNRGLPPAASTDQRQRETELREEIRQLQQALAEEGAAPGSRQRRQAMTLFSNQLETAEREYQNLLDDLRRTEPAYATALALTVPSGAEVRRSLPADTALVEYVLDEDSLVIFVLTTKTLRAKRVSLRREDLRAKVTLLRGLILRRSGDAWHEPAASLASLLFAPVEEAGWLSDIKRIYFVPHGILHYLSFAALPRNRNGVSRLLMEDYDVAYLPAAAALVNTNTADEPNGTLFALAPESSGLRYASQETRRIAWIFPRRRLVLEGARATEDAFNDHANRYRTIHLATHGYLNKLNPLLSRLELEAGKQQDGRLEVHEILDLDLQADLVTLSACDTARGSGYFGGMPAGDDFVGLTRAFLFAGSASVLASLWEVDDQSTPEFMENFYRRMGRGSKAAALADVQRLMWKNAGRDAHPYFWAPFVLVGEMN